jgi:hypothetical protein
MQGDKGDELVFHGVANLGRSLVASSLIGIVALVAYDCFCRFGYNIEEDSFTTSKLKDYVDFAARQLEEFKKNPKQFLQNNSCVQAIIAEQMQQLAQSFGKMSQTNIDSGMTFSDNES